MWRPQEQILRSLLPVPASAATRWVATPGAARDAARCTAKQLCTATWVVAFQPLFP